MQAVIIHGFKYPSPPHLFMLSINTHFLNYHFESQFYLKFADAKTRYISSSNLFHYRREKGRVPDHCCHWKQRGSWDRCIPKFYCWCLLSRLPK